MKQHKQPMRRCIGCNESKEKRDLIRIIRTPEGTICLDPTGKKNGRGAYICPDEACFKKVMKTRALNRAFGAEVPKEVYEELEKEMQAIETG